MDAILHLGALVFAAALSAGLILMLRPLLVRYALAKPNARSSHSLPTPQGGGISIVTVTLLLLALFAAFVPTPATAASDLWPLGVAVLLLAIVGVVDDIRVLPVLPRLTLQIVALALVIATFPDELRAAPMLPLWMERIAALFAGLWFVNLVNFMDGVDWMTVAEVVPITAGVLVLSLAAPLPPLTTAASAVLLGAMIGFAPFNRPVAKLFLGDVGSLPIGLMLFWMLMHLAGTGYVAAALLLPLYYLADATITLMRRLVAGENVAQAHRSHFYQRATDRGWSVIEIVARVFAVNVVLVALAGATVLIHTLATDLVALALGSGAVGGLLFVLVRGQR